MHPHEELLHREYELRAAGDIAGLSEVFAPDVTWTVPGRSAIAGVYAGLDEVLSYARRRQELVNGTFRIEVLDVLAGDVHGVVVARGHCERFGRAWTWIALGLYTFHDGRIASCRLLPEDQYAFDEIWA